MRKIIPGESTIKYYSYTKMVEEYGLLVPKVIVRREITIMEAK